MIETKQINTSGTLSATQGLRHAQPLVRETTEVGGREGKRERDEIDFTREIGGSADRTVSMTAVHGRPLTYPWG